MIMPFLLNRTIDILSLKDTFINHVIVKCNITQRIQVIDQLCNLWILFARLTSLTFKKTFDKFNHNNLNNCIIQWTHLVAKVILFIFRLYF